MRRESKWWVFADALAALWWAPVVLLFLAAIFLPACGPDLAPSPPDAGELRVVYLPDGGIDCAHTTEPTLHCATKKGDHGS